MQELIQKVIQWANDRNIIQGSSATKQLEKTAAELIELAIATGKDEMLFDVKNSLGAPTYNYLQEKVSAEAADGIGDVLVTLIIVAEQHGLDIHDCLASAYDEIKDRKGRMVNGLFIKETQ